MWSHLSDFFCRQEMTASEFALGEAVSSIRMVHGLANDIKDNEVADEDGNASNL